MSTVGIAHVREPTSSKWWWLLLITGILWILIGLFVLQAHYDSAALVGYLVGVLADLRRGRRVRARSGCSRDGGGSMPSLGVLFLLGGFAALTSPFQTFMVLAALIGFFLVLKGTFDFVLGIMLRHVVEFWWMTMIAGILEIAAGHLGDGLPGPFGRAAALLGRHRCDHPRHRRDHRCVPAEEGTRVRRRRSGGGGMKTQCIALVAVIGLSAFALGGCSTQARAERKGKEAGDQICKAKNANNANDAQRHINRANDKLNDLARFTGRDVREEVRDLNRNLNQIARQRDRPGRERDRLERRGGAEGRRRATRRRRTTGCWRRSQTATNRVRGRWLTSSRETIIRRLACADDRHTARGHSVRRRRPRRDRDLRVAGQAQRVPRPHHARVPVGTRRDRRRRRRTRRGSHRRRAARFARAPTSPAAPPRSSRPRPRTGPARRHATAAACSRYASTI